MDFEKKWTLFALEAEEGKFGFDRIANAHNKLQAENADLKRLLAEAVQRVKIANAEGNPILSAWLDGAEKVNV